MFPITTTEYVAAERSHRLEGYRRWSLRRGQSDVVDTDTTPRTTPRGPRTRRPVAHLALGH